MGWRSVTHQNLLKFVNGQKWAKMGKNGRKPCAPTVNLKLKKQLKIKI
jgi:hypothetical protein